MRYEILLSYPSILLDLKTLIFHLFLDLLGSSLSLGIIKGTHLYSIHNNSDLQFGGNRASFDTFSKALSLPWVRSHSLVG